MKNKYVSEKMIQKSRFRDFYGQWENNDKKNLVRIMSRLIKENPDYADQKNYGHMCNLVTSLAMVMALEEKGVPRSEAQNAVAQAMYLFVQPQIASMQKLGSKPWFVGMLKVSMPVKFRHTLGYGWDVEFPKCGKDAFTMITHKCIYQQIFSKYGMPEMTAVFCKVDDILYSNLPRTGFAYTQQIGTGGSMCDYTFSKK